MGEQNVSLLKESKQMERFVQHLLKDVKALKYMIDNDYFEDGITRIGAEQEMCLIDKQCKPAALAMEALDKMQDCAWVETELAKFNLEIGATPREMKDKCLSEMEQEIRDRLNIIQERIQPLDIDILLTGILPTIRKPDLTMDNLTPKKRYFALMEAINSQMFGTAYELRLRGVDEILVKHDSPLLEACNTSFQVHLQVHPRDFVKMYNISQALVAPVMALASNSSVLFGRRLWHESRIALFQQALDTRTTHDHMRERSPRVTFGKEWLKNSILDIYTEDIARFRVLISSDVEEDAYEVIKSGKVPKLRALQVHNSTVYRWNRPCFGISENGKPHLRIENRVLPAGPTILDEMANAAFWLGLMKGYELEVEDITKLMSFEDARDNFGKAARYGIDTKFTWFNNEKISAVDLIVNKLIPIARKGLKSQGIKKADINRYLEVIENRAKAHMTGARWQLQAFTELMKETNRDESVTALTAAILKNQKKSKPVHTWDLPSLKDLGNYLPTTLTVGEFMLTDIITVQKDDILEFVADMMDWRKIRYMPVEDSKGKIVGLVTMRRLLRHFASKDINGKVSKVVKDIMIKNPVSVTPETTILEAVKLLKKNKVGSLPVVQNGELVGIITEQEFLQISGRLMERLAEK